MKILTIIGARPQFIKAAVVSRALRENNIEEILVHTGQHFDKNMSDIFFDEMQIPVPQYNLNIHGLSHGAMTGQMLEKIEAIMLSEKPTHAMVYGDTNSTLAGALAAAKLYIPVIHIEAGLRSFNMHMPEEINRILTDRISTFLFCPTPAAIQNIANENFAGQGIHVVNSGDVMEDSALHFNALAQKQSHILDTLKLSTNNYVLATLHRAENTDDLSKLKNIIESLNNIHKEIEVIMPLHPRTAATLKKAGIQTAIRIVDPVGYLDMTMLTANARLIMTDSGGLQKEAYVFNKYCITLREETEWVELAENGYNFLAGSNPSKITDLFEQLKSKPFLKQHNFYGEGKAAGKIAAYLLKNA